MEIHINSFFVTGPPFGVMWYSTVFPTLFSRKLFGRALSSIACCSITMNGQQNVICMAGT